MLRTPMRMLHASHCLANKCVWEVVVERPPFQRRLHRGKYKSSNTLMFVWRSYCHLHAYNRPESRKAIIV
jgi:hypothetical protein